MASIGKMPQSKTRSDLWKAYKSRQGSAFSKLFGESCDGWTVRKIISECPKYISRLGDVDRDQVQQDLQSAIGLRAKAAELYPLATETDRQAWQAHQFFITILTGLDREIELYSKMDGTKMDDGTTGIDKTESQLPQENLDQTLDGAEFELFLGIIKDGILTTFDRWERALKGTLDVSVATMVSNCAYRELLSLMNTADTLDPHWFHEQFQSSTSHSLLEDLEPARRAISGILHNELSSDVKFLLRVCQSTIAYPSRQLESVLLVDFITTLHEYVRSESNRDFFTFKLSVGAYALLHLRDISNDNLRKLRSSADERISLFDKLIQQERALFQDVDKLVSIREIQSHLSMLDEAWSIGQRYTWAQTNLLEIFKKVLEKPLIPTMMHLYVYLLLKSRSNPVKELDDLCQMADKFLFWNSRPETEKEWQDSLRNWVMLDIPNQGRAIKISSRRHQLQSHLLSLLSKNGYRLDFEIRKRLRKDRNTDISLWDALQSELERELSFPDTITMSYSILRTAKALGKIVTEDEAATYLYQIKDTDKAELFLRLFLQNWRTEERKRCR